MDRVSWYVAAKQQRVDHGVTAHRDAVGTGRACGPIARPLLAAANVPRRDLT